MSRPLARIFKDLRNDSLEMPNTYTGGEQATATSFASDELRCRSRRMVESHIPYDAGEGAMNSVTLCRRTSGQPMPGGSQAKVGPAGQCCGHGVLASGLQVMGDQVRVRPDSSESTWTDSAVCRLWQVGGAREHPTVLGQRSGVGGFGDVAESPRHFFGRAPALEGGDAVLSGHREAFGERSPRWARAIGGKSGRGEFSSRFLQSCTFQPSPVFVKLWRGEESRLMTTLKTSSSKKPRPSSGGDLRRKKATCGVGSDKCESM